MDKIEQFFGATTFNQLLLLLTMTFFACAKVTVQGRASRTYIRNTQDSLLYNAMFFASVAVSMSVVLPLSAPNSTVLGMAAISSVGNVLFQVLYTVALTSGPVSLTVLIVNFSVLIPTAMSFVFLDERLYLSQMLGIACLIISMLLSFNKSEGEMKISKKWMILVIVCLVVNGAQSCVQKLFYQTETSKTVVNSDNTYLVFIYIFSTIFAIAFYLIRANTGKKEKSTYWFSKNVLFYAMVIGAIIAVFQKLYMMGNKLIDGSIMFPSYYGLQSVGMSIIGIILFKDRLNFKQKIGIVTGVASIALMNIKFGFSVSI